MGLARGRVFHPYARRATAQAERLPRTGQGASTSFQARGTRSDVHLCIRPSCPLVGHSRVPLGRNSLLPTKKRVRELASQLPTSSLMPLSSRLWGIWKEGLGHLDKASDGEITDFSFKARHNATRAHRALQYMNQQSFKEWVLKQALAGGKGLYNMIKPRK
eukprot:3132584-Pyramimonas_sp.AAC.1